MRSPMTTCALALIGLVLAACGGTTTATVDVPTRVVLEATAEATAAIAAPTSAAGMPAAPADSVAPTATLVPVTASPSAPPPTATETAAPVVVPPVRASATPGATTTVQVTAPRFATLTPGGSVQVTPVVAADVTITSVELQEAVRALLADNRTIESITLQIQSGDLPGVRVGLVAYGGEALTNGEVLVAFELSGDFVVIRVVEVSVGSGVPPQPYLDTITNDVYPALITAFDGILNERLGEDHDLQSIRFVENRMEIMLLVPQ